MSWLFFPSNQIKYAQNYGAYKLEFKFPKLSFTLLFASPLSDFFSSPPLQQTGRKWFLSPPLLCVARVFLAFSSECASVRKEGKLSFVGFRPGEMKEGGARRCFCPKGGRQTVFGLGVRAAEEDFCVQTITDSSTSYLFEKNGTRAQYGIESAANG